MWHSKATVTKKCLKRYVPQHFWYRLFYCEAGTFRNPLQMCRFILQSSAARLLPKIRRAFIRNSCSD
jgi:hypothetical protein